MPHTYIDGEATDAKGNMDLLTWRINSSPPPTSGNAHWVKLDDVALKDTAPSKVQVILDRGTEKEKDNIKAHRGIQGPSDIG